jgi:pathogenesis-related protein 1
VRLVENAHLQIPAFGAIRHIAAPLDRRTAAWLAARLPIIARRFSIDQRQSIDHSYQWEIIVNTSLKMPGKLFATGALSLIVGALCVACGGGGSDGPAFPVVMVPPPAATAPAAATEPAATPPAAPPEAIAAVPPTAPVAPPPVAPPATPPVALPAAPSTALPTTPPAAPVEPPATPMAPIAPVAPAAPAVAPATPPATSSTDLPKTAFQQEALDAHNKARAEEGKGLSSLKWSAKLQTDAQAWADQCAFSHQVPAGEGQNLFATSKPTATASEAVHDWMTEKADYTYGATGGTCVPGKMCGHYTQVIWQDTTEVGCAVKTCETMKGGISPGTILVCNYSPAGNFIGRPPYRAQ